MKNQFDDEIILLEGHTISSNPLDGNTKSLVLDAKDPLQRPVAAKRIFSHDVTAIHTSLDNTLKLQSQYLLRPLQLLECSGRYFYLITRKATMSL